MGYRNYRQETNMNSNLGLLFKQEGGGEILNETKEIKNKTSRERREE